MARAESRLKRAAKKMGFPCASSTAIASCHQPPSHNNSNSSNSTKVPSSRKPAPTVEAAMTEHTTDHDHQTKQQQQQQSLCVICLEPLAVVYQGVAGGGSKQAIFTAQCMHSFHFTCISSAVDHGGVTCPICRAEWSQLPCNVPSPVPCHHRPAADPAVLRFLNDSIAINVHTHRSSSLPSPLLYDDDDPVQPILSPAPPRLQISLSNYSPRRALPAVSLRSWHAMLQHPTVHFVGPSSIIPSSPQQVLTVQNGVHWLSARLSPQQATDVVVVATPNGAPHVQVLIRQSMALVVFSLRPADRLAIIICSPATATRALPLRRMTSRGKRMALQAIDRVFYLGKADPADGLRKGAKVLEDRAYRNPLSCILHLSDGATLDCAAGQEMRVPFPVHHFPIGIGFGGSTNGQFVMYDQFKEFLSRLLGGVVRETQMRIGEEGHLVTVGELRVGKERRIPLALAAGGCGFLRVGYSFIEGGVEEYCVRTGEVVVGVAEE